LQIERVEPIMKYSLAIYLVVGICNSIGKEKLKIDLPENFQADFMKTFELVMRSDYPNCNINPEEVFGKIGMEFLKRAGASGLDINLEDKGRSKRSINPKTLASKLEKRSIEALKKRSIENDNEPIPAETNERQKRSKLTQLFSPSLVAKLGKRSIVNDNELLPAQFVSEETSKERFRRSEGIATKLKSKIGPSKGTETDDAEIDHNRERRSAYEMLMESIDEVRVRRNADQVRVKRNAHFDQDISKRKRRNVLDMLMDSTQSRNIEF